MTDQIPEGWVTVTAPSHAVRIVSDNGIRVANIPAGETRAVHQDLFVPAMKAGCTSSQSVQGGRIKSHEEVVEDLVDAMVQIMGTGDSTKMTAHDGPRMAALRMHVADFTEPQRQEAWAIVSDQGSTQLDDEVE